MAKKAPRVSAPKDEHRKRADEFLDDEEFKKPKHDQRVDTDIPEEE